MRCPICGATASPSSKENPNRPFCSARCKAVDMGRWLDGSYRIAGEPVDPPDSSTNKDEPS